MPDASAGAGQDASCEITCRLNGADVTRLPLTPERLMDLMER